MKNVLVWTPSIFDIGCGGLNVQYELCRVLKEMGVNVKIQANVNVKNSIFNDYYNNEFDLNDTVVIYGETIDGNPLNAPYVVRWILAPVGVYFDINKCHTWGKNDLVYYFNSEEKINNNPDKIGNIFKMLSIMYISEYIQNNNREPRSGVCYTIRKGKHMRKELIIKHPTNSFGIIESNGIIECVDIFNKYEYFYSYDPLTFLTIIAAMCGCISLVIKVDGLSKEDWLNTLAPIEYLKETGEPLYGVAYGIEEVEFAKDTLHLVEEQWININKFFRKKYVESFINDINNFENQINTLENNFYR
jgi:hypothetical protein